MSDKLTSRLVAAIKAQALNDLKIALAIGENPNVYYGGDSMLGLFGGLLTAIPALS